MKAKPVPGTVLVIWLCNLEGILVVKYDVFSQVSLCKLLYLSVFVILYYLKQTLHVGHEFDFLRCHFLVL